MNLSKRGNVYQLTGRFQGERIRVSTGCRTKEEAELEVPRILAELAQDAAKKVRGGLTVAEGFHRLMVNERREEKGDYAGWKYRTDEITEFLGADTRLIEITERDLLALQSHLMQKSGKGERRAAPATVNRKMAEIAHLLRVACFKWDEIGRPPTVDKIKTPKRRRRAPTQGELETLLDTTAAEFRFLWTFLIETGLRTAEWLALEWTDVDLNEGKINLRVSDHLKIKTDSERVVWLTTTTLAELKLRLAEGHERPLSQYSRQTAKTEWNRVKKEMGLEHDDQFVPYSLRHACATRLVSQGIPVTTIRKWMGHANIATTQIYIDESEDDLRKCAIEATHAVSRSGE